MEATPLREKQLEPGIGCFAALQSASSLKGCFPKGE